MREGTLIEYQVQVHGVSLRWRTRINAWQSPHHFVDERLRGPYRQWIHEHTLEPCNGGTLARDVVRYAVPFDALVHRRFVRPEIEKIFEFRAAELRRRFGDVTAPAIN
jgi:ligand-binding SRPBCC domain-containing protein